MQEVAVGRQHAKFFHYEENLIANINQRIEQYDSALVIYIKHFVKKGLLSRLMPFKAFPGTKEAELAEELLRVNDIIIEKYEGNAFSNPELNKLLKEKNIDEIEVTGIDGGGCVGLIALGATEQGYKVVWNTSAIGTMLPKQAEKLKKKLKEKGTLFSQI